MAKGYSYAPTHVASKHRRLVSRDVLKKLSNEIQVGYLRWFTDTCSLRLGFVVSGDLVIISTLG